MKVWQSVLRGDGFHNFEHFKHIFDDGQKYHGEAKLYYEH